jgi:hypothetical protein
MNHRPIDMEKCVGIASQPRTPQIPAALQDLDQTLSYLIEGVAQLAQRLVPVTQPTPTSGGVGGKTAGGQVDLADAIHRQTKRVRALREQVDGLLSGLEL